MFAYMLYRVFCAPLPSYMKQQSIGRVMEVVWNKEKKNKTDGFSVYKRVILVEMKRKIELWERMQLMQDGLVFPFLRLINSTGTSLWVYEWVSDRNSLSWIKWSFHSNMVLSQVMLYAQNTQNIFLLGSIRSLHRIHWLSPHNESRQK